MARLTRTCWGQWVLAATVLVLAVVGCAGEGPGDGSGEAATPAPGVAALDVSSAAFEDGQPIPTQHTCDGEDISPPLSWRGAPASTAGFAILVSDPDAPGGTFTHWVVAGIDGETTSLEAGDVPTGGIQGTNDFGESSWGGPCPPPGDEPHRYRFTVQATDTNVDLGPDATAEDLRAALDGHVVAEGTLTGSYARQP